MIIETTPRSSAEVGISEPELARRLAERHVPFLARLGESVAAYGWSAAEQAHIGGLDLHLAIPSDERYLWDFVTVPEHRGRGFYPLLLQEIMRRQRGEAEWFWIGHEPTNVASRRGILKAGFRVAGYIWRRADGALVFRGASEAGEQMARHAAAVLGLGR